MKIGFVQFNVEFGQKRENLQKVEQLLTGQQADLWVFPELFNTGYLFTDTKELQDLAEDIPDGETTQFLLKLSEKKNCTLVAGVAEKKKDRFFNSAAIVSRGRFLGVYRKVHLFHREKLFFQPGEGLFPVFEIDDVKIGIMICFDWIFPEAMRTLALKGAQIVCHPSNLVMPYCQNAMITRCLENRVFAVTANRIGSEKRGNISLDFTGSSQITGIKGEILYRSKKDVEEAYLLEIDSEQAKSKQLNELNDIFLDRKPEVYFK